MAAPKSLIINSPYEAPKRHWQPAPDGSLTLAEGRRPAGYELYDVRHNTRRVKELGLVNEIRTRVDAWRAAGYPGVTSVTRHLLEHWHDRSARTLPFYFCQLEAIETLIWHVEASAERKQGIHIPGDGGEWERVCSKMATGTGKTTLMAMIITWQVLNALTYPKRSKDFSRGVFIVAPGLTVKGRLSVLYPSGVGNYYDEFSLCPNETLRQKLNQGVVVIENWHTLMPLKEPQRSVVKKGAESDEAYTRRVLDRLAHERDLLVINDEAHHAYRIPADAKVSKKDAEEHGIDLEEATRWIEGLDRIHKTRRIQRCFDLTATPFAPTGHASTEEGLFDWIVSDFGLNDAIEAGLVKTPRVVVRDDALPDTKSYKSKLYHLYRDPSVQEDLNRRAQPHEPLPDLVQKAYTLLGADWRATAAAWKEAGHVSPPAILTVCNRTETAARIAHYFDKGDAHWPELHAPERTLRIDSKVLEKAEIGESSGSDKDYEEKLRAIVGATDLPADKKERLLALKKEELLREIVDNVGKRGTAGEKLQNVISVAMLSEGWDAKNVTHIMGLRAFTSQLLCEQVIGRGLRRVGYETDDDGLFLPEYVNVFGVPLSVFQDVSGDGAAPPPPAYSQPIESLVERGRYELKWPNVLRVDVVIRPELTVDWSKVESLVIDPTATPITADLAPALGGTTDLSKAHAIDLGKLPDQFRLQRFLFQAARKALESLEGSFRGTRELLVFQLVRLVEELLESDKLVIPSSYHSEPIRKRILFALNIDQIVQHLIAHVQEQNKEHLEPVFDEERPIGSTRDMRTWYTTKPTQPTVRSQVSHMVGDSSWEVYASNVLDKSDVVDAWVKNEHLGFFIYYLWNGARRRYVPDFLIRLANGKKLILEVKGQDTPQNKAKRAELDRWVKAVNEKGGFGTWVHDVVFEPAKLYDVIAKHAKEAVLVKP